MAEALAALEAALTPLLKQIPDLLLQEWRHAEEAKKELESLNDTIGQIRVFLDEAGSEEVVNEQLKMSMKRAWKSLYDSQDAIDDLMRHRSSCQWEGLGVYIYDLYDQQSFTSKARDIREVFEKFASMRKVTRDMIEAIPAHRSSADHATSRSTCRNSSVAYSDESDDELVGIARARELLVEWLLEKDVAPKVIFVHGMQGIGKTTLVGAILRDQRVKREFKYYVWIKDVRSCESSADKDEELMKANAELCDVTNSDNNQGELREILRDLKKNDDRWVLVLDDMSRPDVFESLARHLPQTRPSVLVTTRVSSLASDSQTVLNSLYAGVLGGNPETRGRANLFYDVLLRPISLLSRWVIPFLSGWMVDLISVRSPPRETTPYGVCDFKPDFLSKHDSITLLCRKMGWPDGCPHPLRNALDSILEKCDGLPLAILAACKLLTYSQNHDRDTPQSATWTSLSSRLGEELLIKRDKDRAIKEMTTLRIDHLQDVKTCLFYLSTFPLDRPVKCSTLIRLWMAERFIVQTGAKPLQTIAEESLQKIVDHNLIQKVEKTSYGRISAFRVHNIMHQILVSKSRDVEFVTTVADPAVPWPETIWRLSFHIPMESISKDMPVNRLRSLFVFAAVYPQSMRELLGKVKRLNVLDLRDSSLNSFPKEILKLLYLRYLSLRGTKVHIIPDAIGDLTHLETLDLKHTAVSKLPKGILKLKKLRHLLVYRFDENPTATQPKYGIKSPSELGVLTSVEKLCFVEMKEKKSQEHFQSKEAKFLAGVGNLERLLRLGISKLRKEHGEFLCSALVKLTKLESIHLIAATGGETIDLLSIDKSKAFPFLQRVQLIGSLRVLPEWISSLTSLVKLVLKESRLIEDPLNHLQHLPYLKHLALHETFDASRITFLTGGFQQLRFLGLDTFDDLTAIDAEEEALPTLERLFLARCKLLTTVPQVVTRPRKLNCLELYSMPDEFRTNVEGNKEVGARMKVVKKWRDGIVDYNVMQRKAVIRRTDGSSSWPPPPSICGKYLTSMALRKPLFLLPTKIGEDEVQIPVLVDS